MPVAQLTIVNRLGLHARAAAKFVQTAAHYGCEVQVCKDGKKVNGKSIMGVMMLAAAQGAEIEISTSGADEQAALDALAALIADKFGEPS
ncbi:MAG: HPr family phosphocarrier protein [Gammaproteobacteria bacterium]|jgi:phosphocarrier protein HPr|nr:HPr family phosphocarrier protein [Gammaproteobacteria bacterium]